MMMTAAPLEHDIAESPRHGMAYWIESTDGVKLRVGAWKANNIDRGTVFIFPGRTEYIEKYGRTISGFEKVGLSTIVVDWRGQGLSERLSQNRTIGHITSYTEYQKDVAALVAAGKALDLPKPWYLFGHSMGAAIGLRALIEGSPFTACAFTSPMWNIKLPTAKRFAAWPLCWLAQLAGKSECFAPGTDGTSYVLKVPFCDNRLTTDSDMYEYFIRHAKSLPLHQIGGPSMSWLYQTLKDNKALTDVRSPSTPCISFCGAQDEVIEVSDAERRMSAWKGGKFRIIKGAKHDILSEIPAIRDEVIRDIVGLFDSTRSGLLDRV